MPQRSFVCFLLGALLIISPMSGQAQTGLNTASAARFGQLDRFAKQLPEAQATTITQLARSLAAAAQSDDEKARLIFAWLAYHVAYDTDYLRGNRSWGYSPAEVLRNRRAICQGYADLFTTLAWLMQVPAHTVTGYARIAPGDRPAGPLDTNHAWNVYQTCGRWHLADATWGAGAVTTAGKYVAGFSPLWFDTPPAAAIFSHLPLEARWQLLPKPVEVTQFASWPYVSTELFRLGASGAGLLRALERSRQPQLVQLPEVYTSGLDVAVEQVPLRSELEPHRPVVFRFAAGADVELGLHDGRRIQKIAPAGPLREATLRPEPGELRVVAWSRSNPGTYYTLLRYHVSRALPKRLLRQQFPDSVNVAYLVRYRAHWVEPVASVPAPLVSLAR